MIMCTDYIRNYRNRDPMHIYQQRERQIKFLSGKTPEFPAEVAINVSLEPLVSFGGHAGETTNVVGGQSFKIRTNLSTGKFYVKVDSPLFEKLGANVKNGTTEFSITGNIATIRTNCASLQELSDRLAMLHFVFPAILNVYLPDAPHSLYAWGTAGSEKFQLHFHPDGLRGGVTNTSKEHQEQLVINSWMDAQHVATSMRLFGALTYFQIACRLLNAGTSRFEFIAESLLNMAKCMQALFGESRDSARDELRLLGYSDNEIESEFIPALILRNEFDIAHVSLSLLSREELSILHRYAYIAERSFRIMLQKVLSGVAAGTYMLPGDPDLTLSKDKKKILAKIDVLTKRFS